VSPLPAIGLSSMDTRASGNAGRKTDHWYLQRRSCFHPGVGTWPIARSVHIGSMSDWYTGFSGSKLSTGFLDFSCQIHGRSPIWGHASVCKKLYVKPEA
jgi:hypothetical protein